MAETPGLKPIERSGDQAGTWKWEETNDTDYWSDSLLANPALPPIWSATVNYTEGNPVFYNGAIYTAINDVSATTTTPAADRDNWQRTGASVQEVRSGPNSGLGSRSVIPTNGAGLYRFRFNTNEVAAGEPTEFIASTDNANTGGNDVLITLNHPPAGTGTGGGLTSVTSDDTLSGTGTSASPLGISDAVRNQLLLINGFLLLTRGSTTGTRTAYTGMLPGFDTTSQTYYFDTSDSSWYDVSTGGTALIGF